MIREIELLRQAHAWHVPRDGLLRGERLVQHGITQ